MVDHLRQVFRYRELVRNLVLRDLKVRYRNSVLGFFWAWGNPILMTLIFTTVFTVLQKSSVLHYPLFIMIGWLAWMFTTGAVTEGVSSVVSNSNLVKKIYFPREVLPASVVLANATNFLFAFPLILVLALLSGVKLEPLLLIYFPIIFISQIALVLGIAFVLSAVNVYLRDTGVIIGVLIFAWFFLTPIFYSQSALTGTLNGIDLSRLVRYVNPMASIIEAYRNIFYGSVEGGPPGPPALDFLSRTLVTTLAILFLGYAVFIRLSRRFGEEL
jgi:lipopolysaccharide transport system permease protein